MQRNNNETMPTIIPIYHTSGSISGEEAKVMQGVFIILCAIWVLTTIYLIIKYYQDDEDDFFWYFFSGGG